MEDNKILKLVYTFFVGLLITLFIGVGISTFYPSPTGPEYPVAAETYGREPTEKEVQAQKEFEERRIQYEKNELQPYNRNVSIILIVAAVILLTLSIVFENKIKVISDGVMLGGLFTLIYGIGRGFASQNTKYVFVIITVSLASVLYLGYKRFVKSKDKVKNTIES